MSDVAYGNTKLVSRGWFPVAVEWTLVSEVHALPSSLPPQTQSAPATSWWQQPSQFSHLFFSWQAKSPPEVLGIYSVQKERSLNYDRKRFIEPLLVTGHKQAAQGDRRGGAGHRQKEEESPEREEKGNMVTQFLKPHQKTSADDWTQQKRSSFPASVSFT